MTEQEISDWEREIKHAAKMQEQREGKQRLDIIRATYDVPRNTYSIKDDSNEK